MITKVKWSKLATPLNERAAQNKKVPKESGPFLFDKWSLKPNWE